MNILEEQCIYSCIIDTYVICQKIVKKRNSQKLQKRAIRIRQKDIVVCLSLQEQENGQVNGIFLLNDEFINFTEHRSTLKAISKCLVKINLVNHQAIEG